MGSSFPWNMGGLRETLLSGRPRASIAALALALLVLMPVALAGANIQAGPATVVIVDENGSDCAPRVADACLVAMKGDGTLGGTTIDAHQDLRYVGIALAMGGWTTRVGAFDLLPGGGLVLDGEQLYVRQPATRIATELIQNWTSPAPGVFNPTPNEKNFSFDYLRPDPTYPGLLRPYRFSLKWADGDGIGYEQVGPVNHPIGAPTTDGWIDSFVTRAPCQYQPRAACPAAQQVNSTWTNATPNVIVGVNIDRAHLATDPAQLRYGATRPATDDREPDPLPRASPDAVPLDRTRPSSDPLTLQPSDGSHDELERPGVTTDEEREAGVVETLAQQPMLPAAVHVWALVAAGAAAAALVAVAFAVALYSRITSRPQALRHPVRVRLLELIRQNPATSPTELAPLVGLTRNAVVHHVRILQRAGLVRIEERERRTFLFSAHVDTSSTPEVLCRLVGDDPLLEVLLDAPEGLTRPEIRERVPDVPERTRNHRLQRLLERGVLTMEGSGRSARYQVQPEVRDHLASNRSSGSA